MQLKFVLTILAAIVPLAISTSVGSKSCKSDEFWWTDKECCLQKGGPTHPPPPPKNTDCPPTSYYWGEKQGCCVPRNPPPSNPPPPQCPRGWTWYPTLHRCHLTPTPPSPPPSHPSSYGNGQYGNHGYRKRDLKARTSLCPTGLDACPVSGLTGDYECLDTDTELESCGGCTTLGRGQDCTSITGAWNVGCEQGTCVVYTCAGGFQVGADGKSCLPL